LVME